MAVVVEVAYERRLASRVEHPLLDLRNCRGGFRDVHCDAHHLRAGFRQLDALLRGRGGIRGVGHRHRLHDDRCAAADEHAADFDADGLVKPG